MSEGIKVINIDEVPYAVDTLSDQAQSLVSVFNQWMLDEEALRRDLYKMELAKGALEQQIVAQVRKDQEEAAPVESNGATPAAPPVPADVSPADESNTHHLDDEFNPGFVD